MKHPDYDKSKFTLWALPHPMILHWILNPGLAFNELILGQRMPRVSLIDKTSDKPLAERCYIPCPHCGTFHDGRLWGKGNAFGHWFGFVCPTCGKSIPCLWNIFSLVILTVTWPIWVLPAHFLRPKWLEFEKERMKRNQNRPLVEAKKINWIARGTFIFGGLMWIIMAVAPAVFKAMRGQEMDWVFIGIQLPIWLVSGLVWGLIMQVLMNKKPNKVASSAD